MSKYFLYGLVSILFVAASVTAAVSATKDSILYDPTLQEKYIPNNIDLLKQPNAFQKNTTNSSNSFNDLFVNPGNNAGYNSGCQFGFCPDQSEGATPEDSVVE